MTQEKMSAQTDCHITVTFRRNESVSFNLDTGETFTIHWKKEKPLVTIIAK